MKLLATVNNGPDLEFDLSQELAKISLLETEPGVYSIMTADGASVQARIHAQPNAGWQVEIAGRTHNVEIRDPRERTRRGAGAGAAGRQNILAPMPGKVVRILVAAGDQVEAGQGLIVVEAMKMQNEMKSPKAGVVALINTTEGATVAVGETLLVIE